MNGHVFPKWMEGAIVAGYECACGGSDEPITVGYPIITEGAEEVFIRYPLTCSCGRFHVFDIRMPILLFGYLLARSKLANVRNPGHRQFRKLTIQPRSSDTLIRYLGDYFHLVGGPKLAEPMRLGQLDRLQLQIGGNDWPEFVRRLGFELESEDCT